MGRPTHEVTNQPPPLTGYDVFRADSALVEGVRRYPGAAHLEKMSTLGRRAGSEPAQRWATEANAHPPVLRTHDRFGYRIDEVDFHPSWPALMDVAVSPGLRAPAGKSGLLAGMVVADAFCATRLTDTWGPAAGMLPSTVDCSGLVARAAPVDAS